MAPPKTPPKFDQAKLQQMNSPFTVRVERMEGNRREPISLPPKEGYNVGGPGWEYDEVLGLEGWISKEWSGGGTYVFSITDSSSPPQTMEWTGLFPYPKKVPPTMSDMAPAPVVQQPSAPGYQIWPPPAPQPWGAPAPQPMPGPLPWASNTHSFNPYYNPYGGVFGGYAPPFPPPASAVAKPKDELDQLKLENEKLRLAQQEERHQTQMRAQEEQHRRDMEAIRTEMRNMAAKPQGDSDDVKQMRERLEREREDRQRMEREAAEARHRAELESIKARIDAKPAVDPAIAELKAQRDADERRREEDRRREDDRRAHEREMQLLQEQVRALRDQPKGPDPMMMMMIEQMKQNNEAAKEQARINSERDREIARANADALRELKTQMVHPAEMFRMVRDASSGQDQIITSTVSTLNSVFNTAQQWMNSVMQQMGGGGESPAYRLIEGGMQQVEQMVKRWMETKAQRDVAQSQAQREAAKAATAQAQAFTASHVPQPQPPPPTPAPGWQTPPPVTQPTQAQGQPANGNGSNGAGLAGAAPAAPTSKMRNGGKTDEQWFGPALKDVAALRAEAMKFEQNAKAKPPKLDDKGIPIGTGPDQAAGFIIQAAALIRQQNIEILAFTKLFEQQMYANLVDIIFPDSDPGYRADVVRFLHQLLEGASPEVVTAEATA